jgi:hypothetical protein
MVNLCAPILPGQGAASIILGTDGQEILSHTTVEFQAEEIGQSGLVRYRSANVDLWVKNGLVEQILVHGQYSGLLLQKIRLSSTIDEVRRLHGPVSLDDEDNLVIERVPGLCFEIDVHQYSSPITEIYVFRT